MSECPLCQSEAAEQEGVWAWCSNDDCDMSQEWLPMGAWKALSAIGRDAARYRWLRHGDNDELILNDYEPGFIIDGVPKAFLPRGEKLDAAIDAEMKAETGRAL